MLFLSNYISITVFIIFNQKFIIKVAMIITGNVFQLFMIVVN